MEYNNITIIIPKSSMYEENLWMVQNIDPDGGEYTFTQTFTKDGSDYSISHLLVTEEQKTLIDTHFSNIYDGNVSIDQSGIISVDGDAVANTNFPEPPYYIDNTGNKLYINGDKFYQDLQLQNGSNSKIVIIDSEDGNSLKQIDYSSIIR